MLKMYRELAKWWPLLSPPSDYAEEAAFYARLLTDGIATSDATLLELGSGGGNNASYLKAHFAHTTLVDLSPDMLAISRALNPDCEHLVGDMRTVRLGRQFDAVFIHDAIDYMLTADELRQAFETAFLHCKPGGGALFAPDHVRETFRAETEHGGTDGEGRAMRYLEWTHDPDASDTTYMTDYIYVLREDAQPVLVEHEQHVCGLFSRAEWLRLLSEVGFQATVVSDAFERELFVARKPL